MMSAIFNTNTSTPQPSQETIVCVHKDEHTHTTEQDDIYGEYFAQLELEQQQAA